MLNRLTKSQSVYLLNDVEIIQIRFRIQSSVWEGLPSFGCGFLKPRIFVRKSQSHGDSKYGLALRILRNLDCWLMLDEMSRNQLIMQKIAAQYYRM